MNRFFLLVFVFPILACLAALVALALGVKNAGVWCGGVAVLSLAFAGVLARRGKLIPGGE